MMQPRSLVAAAVSLFSWMLILRELNDVIKSTSTSRHNVARVTCSLKISSRKLNNVRSTSAILKRIAKVDYKGVVYFRNNATYHFEHGMFIYLILWIEKTLYRKNTHGKLHITNHTTWLWASVCVIAQVLRNRLYC